MKFFVKFGVDSNLNCNFVVMDVYIQCVYYLVKLLEWVNVCTIFR